MGPEFLVDGAARRAGEWRRTGEKREECATKTVDVGPDVHFMTRLPLFRSHVIGRPHHLSACGESLGSRIASKKSQTKIEKFHFTFRREHEIAGLDVPVNQSVLVCVLESDCRLTHQFTGDRNRQRTCPANQAGQIDSIDKIHRQIVKPVGVTRIRGPDYIRVIEPPDHFHLALEAGDHSRIADTTWRKQLDRHPLLQSDVLGTVNQTHPTSPDPLERLVMTESLGRRQVLTTKARQKGSQGLGQHALIAWVIGYGRDTG
jgi:hypothetical protein